MSEVYTHTPLEVAEGILSGKYTLTNVFVFVNQIEDLTRERDDARAEVERRRDQVGELITEVERLRLALRCVWKVSRRTASFVSIQRIANKALDIREGGR